MHDRYRQNRDKLSIALIVLIIIGVLATLLLWPGLVVAEEQSVDGATVWVKLPEPNAKVAPKSQSDEPVHPPTDLACRQCHGDTEREIEFPSGESLPVVVDLESLANSAHGEQSESPLACNDCHAPVDYQFPHEPVTEDDLRQYQVARSATCERCHQQPHITSHPGPESENAVLCTDCHGAHDTLTTVQLQTGEGTGACVDCHQQREVGLTDSVVLSQLIRDGLFTDSPDSDYCLACHVREDLTITFENGDVVSATIDRDNFHDSVHGADNSWQQLECADCHGKLSYPHEPIEATSYRQYSLDSNQRCKRCHEPNFEKALDSVHGEALNEGNIEAAMCTDCHGAHDTPPPSEPRDRISHTCQQCHSTIFDTYAESVHGADLLEEGNPDVATCIDCHGVHDINNPTTELARARSPQLCADCHADEDLMAKYDVSTDVFETYLHDFHGTTVALYDPDDPDALVLTAVCYDCHGVHDIRPVDDADNSIKANLLVTCQQCHPDANDNFPDAWTSHFEPSPDNNTLVWLVDTFYAIVIPVTVGGLGFLVVTDIFRIIRIRFFKKDR